MPLMLILFSGQESLWGGLLVHCLVLPQKKAARDYRMSASQSDATLDSVGNLSSLKWTLNSITTTFIAISLVSKTMQA